MHPIGAEPITIGRAPDNAIVVQNASVSRRHARIRHEGGRWLVEDLGTKNGTLKNGKRIEAPEALGEGDEIAVPGFTAKFHATDETMTIVVRTGPQLSATKSFLFADLRGYTSFTERHGDAAASEIVTEYRRLARAEIARTGGREMQIEGDGIFVVFDSAHRAVECALAILAASADHTTRRPDRPVRVGIGVHAGEPIVQDGDYVGLAVNVAARLAQNARAGELLVSDVVRGLVRASALPPMTLREEIVLKGVDDPPRVYVMTPPPPAPVETPR
jgi:class 3 adenylate cyclase